MEKFFLHNLSPFPTLTFFKNFNLFFISSLSDCSSFNLYSLFLKKKKGNLALLEKSPQQ